MKLPFKKFLLFRNESFSFHLLTGCLLFSTIAVVAQIPVITSFSPASGPVGTSVTITGTNFSSTPSNNIVYFGATKANVASATATQLMVTVPVGATYQPISVTITSSGLTAWSGKPFSVTFQATYLIDNNSFSSQIDFITGSSPIDIASGDIDGDGKTDLVVVNDGSNTVSVFRNTSISGSISASSFAAKVDFATGGSPRSVAIGDLDGDGKADLAVANYNNNTVSIFRNTSTPGSIIASSLATKVDFTTGGPCVGVAIGDLDKDGKADLAVANYNTNSLSIFRNTSTIGSITTGSFAAKVDFSTGLRPANVAIGDLDGDGKIDLATANRDGNSISIFRNTSTPGSITAGSFAAKVDLTSGSSTSHIAVGDLDGDDKPDLAVTCYTNYSSVTILRNISTTGSLNASSFSSGVSFATTGNQKSVSIGNLDGDGKADIATANNFLTLFRNTSTSGSITSNSFSAGVNFSTGILPYNPTIGDFDGDGKADVAVANFSSNTISVFRNLASGPTITSFSPQTGLVGSSVTITGANFSSISADNIVYFGATKAAITSASSTQLVVTVPSGATYNPITVTVNGLTAWTSIPFIVTFPSGQTIDNNSFASRLDLVTGAQPYRVICGDLDLDGRADLVVANNGSNTVSLLRNTSASGSITTASFANRVDLTVGGSPRNIDIGDLDGDGKKDLAVVNYTSNTVSILRNISTSGSITSSSFAAKVDFATGSYPLGVAIGDLDGDGKADLVVTNVSSNTVSFFRNISSLGSIAFAPKVDFTTGASPVSVAVGDLDGDGKADLAVVNLNSNTVSVFRNTGSFAAKVDFSTGLQPQRVAIGDLDGDGKADLAVTNYGNNTFSVLRNISTPGVITTGSFAGKVDFTTAAAPLMIAFNDLNGDEKVDLAVVNSGSNTVSVYRNTSTPGSITSVSLSGGVNFATNSSPHSISIGDLDGDAKPDLAVSHISSSTVSLFRNRVIAVEPAAQPASFSSVNSSSTQNNLSFPAASTITNGYGYIILRRQDGTYPTISGVIDQVVPGSLSLPSGTSLVANISNSNSATFNDTGLSPETNYRYAIIPYNIYLADQATCNYKTDGTILNTDATTIALEPTTQPSEISFASITTNSMNVSFASEIGLPDGYLALMKMSSSPTDEPVDRMAYTAGNTIGTSIVAYAGNSTSFSVSGLSAATKYYFDIFSYNGSTGTYNYLTTLPLEGSQSTLATEPTNQPTGLFFSNITSSGMTLSFTAAAGTPVGYLALMRGGAPSTDLPIDGTSYAEGNAIGLSTVVYAGNGTSFSISSLSASTVYYFDIFSYNGTTGTYNYLTSLQLEGSQITHATEPTSPPSGINVSSITSNSMNVSFTAAPGTPDGYLALMKPGSSPADVPADGTSYTVGYTIGTSTVLYSGNSTSFSVSGLTAGTIYYFDIFSYNGTTGTYNYLTTTRLEGSQITHATEPAAQPTALTFSSVTSSGMTLIFTPAAGPPSGYLGLMKTVSSPTEVPVDGTAYTTGNTMGASTVVYAGSGASFSVSNLTASTVYYFDIFSYNGSIGTYNYLTTSSLEGSQITHAIEPTAQPTSLTLSDITATSMNGSFSAASGSPAGYLVVVKGEGSSSDVPVDGTTYTVGNFGASQVIYAGSATSFSSTGLTAATTYYYKVYAYNGEGASVNYLIANPAEGNAMTLAVAPVAKPPTNATPSSFTANWDAVSGAVSYELDVSRNNFATLESGFPKTGITGIEYTVDNLTPSTTYKYVVRAVNANGGKSGSSNSVTATTSASPADGLKINTTAASSTIQVGFGTTKPSVNVSGGTPPYTVVMKHRKITGDQFQILNATLTSGNDYEVTVAESHLDELGLEYFFEATDQDNSQASQSAHSFLYRSITTSSNTFIPFAPGFNGKTNTYQMFSIPYALANTDIGNLFDVALNGYDNTQWRLFHYENNSHKEYPNQFRQVKLGDGYWFNTIINDFQIKLGEATVAQQNQSDSFEKPLEAGWNQIGNPYPFNLDWSAVADGNDKVGPLWFFSNGAYSKSNIFKPWTGAFVHADEAMTLPIPVLAKTTASGRTSNHELAADLDAEQWLLPITLRINDLQQVSGVGMHPQAKTSKDKFDEITIPRFVDYAEMNTYHEEFFSPRFSTDVVPTSEEQVWTFDVKSNLEDHHGELTWNHTSIAPNKSSLILIDLFDGKWVDMKTTGAYSFTHREGRQFRIIYNRKGEIRPGVTLVGEAYPNPFALEVTFPVLVDEPGYKQIAIYDGIGRKVKMIGKEFSEPGLHELKWNLKDDAGSEVSSGMLFYRMEGGLNRQMKRIVRK